MVITNMIRRKKSDILLFVDGKYAFSVDEETAFKNKLSVGFNVDEALLNKIESQVGENKSREKALRLLSYRSHSKKELIDKIKRKHGAECANKAADKMESLGLVNDKNFALEYARSLFGRLYSVKRVVFELTKKGIERDIISEVIEEISPDEESQILSIIEKKYKSSTLSEEDIRKTFSRLKNSGYSASDISRAIFMYREGHKNGLDL